MTTYSCCCTKQCPGSMRIFVEKNSEKETRVVLEIWTATMSKHTIYLSPGDAEALGEEMKRAAAAVKDIGEKDTFSSLAPTERCIKVRRVLRPDDELPSIAELSGSDPRFTGDATTEEYIRWGRKFYRP